MEKIKRDDARRYFWDNGLTYEKVMFQDNIDKLKDFINSEVANFNLFNPYPYFVKVIDSSTKVFNYNGQGHTCFIRGKGGYFSDREMVSFNFEKDSNTGNPHWIGFAGDADDNNVQPVLRAFIRWVDYLKERQ